MKKFFKKNFLVLILLVSLLLRLVSINQGLWLDEAIGAIEVKKHGIFGIITEYMKYDFHPPLYYLVLEVWSWFFGLSDLAIRILSVFMGVATVLVFYLIAREIFDRKNHKALLAALFLATSPFHIYYSQEARMYVMTALLSCLSIYFYVLLLKKQKLILWILFSVSITALVFTDYLPVFLLPVFWLHSLIRGEKKLLLALLLTHIPILILGIFWFPMLSVQLASVRWLASTLPAWEKIIGGATAKQLFLVWPKFVLGRVSFFPKAVYYLVILAASVPYAIAFLCSLRVVKKFTAIFLWFFLPLIISFLLSFFFPALSYFRLFYIYPAFLLVAFLGIYTIRDSKFRNIVFASLLVVNLAGFLIYTLDKSQQREQWREVVKYVEMEAGDEKAAIFVYPEPFAPYRWYQSGALDAFGVTDSISANEKDTVEKTKNAISGKNTLYYFSYLEDLTDPNGYVKNTLKSDGFKIIKTVGDFKGIGTIYIWERK